MFLNSKHNNFVFRFPKDFFPKHIQEKYEVYLEKTKAPYKNFTEFMNSTIQEVSFPKYKIDTVQQNEIRPDKLTPAYRQGLSALKFIDRTFTVKFKHIEGFINYFALYESIIWTHTPDNDKEYLPDLKMFILNNEKQKIVEVKMERVLYKSSPEDLTFSYADVRNKASSFTIEFYWNGFNIELLYENLLNKVTGYKFSD